MCTVSWLHQADGYHVLFNRDEKLTRAAGIAPRIHERSGMRYIAPQDGDALGTWIAANEAGIALCLLNGANLGGDEHAPARRRSRGQLPLDLITADTLPGVLHAVQRIDLSRFAPFTLSAFEPGLPAAVVEWDGRDQAMFPNAERFLPLLSSSVDSDLVRARRRAEFRRATDVAGGAALAALRYFHSSHGPERSAYSPCMHRADAETVSFSQIAVDSEFVRFYYAPGPPCGGSPGETLTLRRR